MKKFPQKGIVAILTFTVILSGVFSPYFYANAVWPVIDNTHIATTIANFAKEVARWLKEDRWKILRDQVVKMIIDRITDDIVRSIYNEGDPSYVQDWKSYLREAGDVVFNQLNNELDKVGPNLCAPFVPSITVDLRARLNYPFGRIPVECSFQEFKNNLENSTNLIESGGWLMYDTMFVPENNYWLFSELVEDEYTRKVKEEVESRKNEALSSSGFLPLKRCVQLSKGITQEEIEEECTDENGNIDSACVDYATKKLCEKWETLTPGDSVAESMRNVVGSDFKYITNVQSIISALVNVMVMKILDKAKGGISGAIGHDSGSSYSYGVDDGTSDEINDFNESRLNNIKEKYQSFINYIGNSVLPYVNNSLNIIQGISCVDNTISFIDADGNEQTTTIGDLQQFLLNSKNGLETALNEAQTNLNFINSMDFESTQDVVKVINDYENFVSKYPLLLTDLSQAEVGGSGNLEITYGNIYQALQSFTCPE